ncbi:hypothetical protein AB0G05_30605 [Nonomuraea wenchangensis]
MMVLVAVLLLNLGAQGFQRRGDRDDCRLNVLGTALQVANPGYWTDVMSCCDTTPFSLSFTVRLTPLRAGGYSLAHQFSGGAVLTVSQNQFGRVEWPPLGFSKETFLFTALDSVGQDARLPESMYALAVVEFAGPLGEREFSAFVQRHGRVPPEIAIYRAGGTPISRRLDTLLPDAPQGDVPELAAAELSRNGLPGSAAGAAAYAIMTRSTWRNSDSGWSRPPTASRTPMSPSTPASPTSAP